MAAAPNSSQKSLQEKTSKVTAYSPPEGYQESSLPTLPSPSTKAKSSGERDQLPTEPVLIEEANTSRKGILSFCRALEKDPCRIQLQIRKTPFPKTGELVINL